MRGRSADVRDDRVCGPLMLRLWGAGEAVLDDLLAKLVAETCVSQNCVEGGDDSVAAGVCGGHLSPDRLGDEHRLGGRGGDEHHAAKSVRTLAGEQLRDLASHAVPDQDVVIEAEGGDHGRHVGGEIADRISLHGSAGLPPATVIERYAPGRIGQPLDHRVPGSARAAPVVHEHQCRHPLAGLLDGQRRRAGIDERILKVKSGHVTNLRELRATRRLSRYGLPPVA